MCWKIFLLFSLSSLFYPSDGAHHNIHELRDSISAEIEMRTTTRPIIYLFSSNLAHSLIPHLQSLLSLSSSDISPCYNLNLIRPEMKLQEFVSNHMDGSIVLFTGIESLNGNINITKLNFLHSVSDSVSGYGNLIVILIWNSMIRPFPLSTNELYSFLQSHEEEKKNENEKITISSNNILNSRALIGRISRIEGGGTGKSDDHSEDSHHDSWNNDLLPFICNREKEKSDWTPLYLIVTLLAILGTVIANFTFQTETATATATSSSKKFSSQTTPLVSSTSSSQVSQLIPNKTKSKKENEEEKMKVCVERVVDEGKEIDEQFRGVRLVDKEKMRPSRKGEKNQKREKGSTW
jgi:hypothetical protein